MALILYLAVLLVSISGIVFGLDWLAAPPPHYQTPPVSVATRHAPPVRHLGSDAATRGPASPAEKVHQVDVAPAAATRPLPQSSVPRVATADSAPALPSADENTEPTALAAAEPPPKCDLRACAAAYVSFRASDCTYQPIEGPRRLCEKGHPPQAAPPVARQAATAPPRCNVEACRQAYFTFNPADCTYQPLHGPRRLCEK